MPRFPLNAFAAVLLASAGAMLAGAALGAQWLSGMAASLAAFAAVAWTGAFARAEEPPISRDRRLSAVQRSANAAALVYAWGGGAMLGVYSLSGLSWEHGWQYGLAMALIAAGIFAYGRGIGAEPGAAVRARRLRWASWLTALHGLAAVGALVFLVSSGKLWSGKSDWAANHIFLAGGLAIAAICAVSVATQAALARADRLNRIKTR